jgi:hypothetical protein
MIRIAYFVLQAAWSLFPGTTLDHDLPLADEHSSHSRWTPLTDREQAKAGNARDAIHSSPVDRCLLQVDDRRSIECGNRW